MKIQIEKEIEVHTDRNFDSLNQIINAALNSDSVGKAKALISQIKWLSGDYHVAYGITSLAAKMN